MNAQTYLFGGIIAGSIITLLAWPKNNPITYILESMKLEYTKYKTLSIIHKRLLKIIFPLSEDCVENILDSTWILIFKDGGINKVVASEQLILGFLNKEEAESLVSKMNINVPLIPITMKEVKKKKLILIKDSL